MDAIERISGHYQGAVSKPGQAREDVNQNFAQTLKSLYQNVNQQLVEADQKVGEFALGERHDLHEIMVATEKADISFKLLVQIRNKLLEAYQEIIRMQF